MLLNVRQNRYWQNTSSKKLSMISLLFTLIFICWPLPKLPASNLPETQPSIEETASSVPESSLVTQEFRYHIAGAGEVWLVWGVNNWQVIPETMRPHETMLKNSVMHTRMVREKDAFIARVQVSSGTIIDYGFLTTKTRDGAVIKIWQDDGGKDFHLAVTRDGRTEVASAATVSLADTSQNANTLWPKLLIGACGALVILALALILRTGLRQLSDKMRYPLRIVSLNLAFIVCGFLILELFFGNWINATRLDRLNIPRDVELVLNVDHLYSSSNTTITYRRDKYGLRGHYRDPAAIDILTLGGSTTDQRAISEGFTWQDVLGRDFLSHGKEVTVVNAGVDGQSTYGHLKDFDLWFPRIPQLRVRYFLFYIGVNDFWADENSEYDVLSRESQSSQLDDWVSAVQDRSAIYHVYRTLKGMYLAKSAYHLGHERVEWHKISYSDRPLVLDHQKLMDNRIRAFEKRLRALVQKVRALGGTPVFATQTYRTHKLENGRLLGFSTPRAFAGTEINGVDLYLIMGIINEKTMEVCQASGGICIDLATELAFEDNDFYDTAHNTPKGAEKIGHYLYSKLQGVL